jgi:hypothetical protein
MFRACWAQVLLSRLYIMHSPGYPYEQELREYLNQTNTVMCSYLPQYKNFNVTKGLLLNLFLDLFAATTYIGWQLCNIQRVNPHWSLACVQTRCVYIPDLEWEKWHRPSSLLSTCPCASHWI